jgi:GH24 family phage-related lysozyme (muramidase)
MKSDAKNQVFLMKKFQKKSKPKQNFGTVSDKCLSYDIKRASHQPLWTLQRKPHLNKAEDEYEREADHVAEQILQMTDAGFRSQRELGSGDHVDRSGFAEKPEQIFKTKRRPNHFDPTRRNNNSVSARRKTPLDSSTLQSGFAQKIESLKGGGRPLSAATRKLIEPPFNQDFSKVRIHTGQQADKAAQSINAEAFTTGRDIVFGSGAYRPETQPGKQLLAHELTHVLQQNEGGVGLESGATGETVQRQKSKSPLADPADVYVPDRPMGDVERQQFRRELAKGTQYRQTDRPMGEAERQIQSMRPSLKSGKRVENLSPSAKVLEFIRKHEALRLQPYNIAGDCTIGYGHLIRHSKCENSDLPDEFQGGITEQRARELFRQDVNSVAGTIRGYIDVKLTQHEFDALISFGYNAGPGDVVNSGIAAAINNYLSHRVPDLLQQPEYTHAEGKEYAGLVKRRKQEADMFQRGVYP